MGGGGHQRNLGAYVEAPYSGGDRTDAPAHFLGHGADHLRWFAAARDQRAHPPHGHLLRNEPAILGVQLPAVHGLAGSPGGSFFDRLRSRCVEPFQRLGSGRLGISEREPGERPMPLTL